MFVNHFLAKPLKIWFWNFEYSFVYHLRWSSLNFFPIGPKMSVCPSIRNFNLILLKNSMAATKHRWPWPLVYSNFPMAHCVRRLIADSLMDYFEIWQESWHDACCFGILRERYYCNKKKKIAVFRYALVFLLLWPLGSTFFCPQSTRLDLPKNPNGKKKKILTS